MHNCPEALIIMAAHWGDYGSAPASAKLRVTCNLNPTAQTSETNQGWVSTLLMRRSAVTHSDECALRRPMTHHSKAALCASESGRFSTNFCLLLPPDSYSFLHLSALACVLPKPCLVSFSALKGSSDQVKKKFNLWLVDFEQSDAPLRW